MDVGHKFESLLVFELLRADSFPEDRIPAQPLPCLKSLVTCLLSLWISSYSSSSSAPIFSPDPNFSTLLKMAPYWKPSVSILEEVGIREDLLR